MAYVTMKQMLMILSGFWVGVTLLPLLRTGVWWIRILDFPRLQLAILATLTLVVFIWVANMHTVLDLAVVFALMVCILYQISQIYPYTPLAPVQAQRSEQAKPPARFRLFVANIQMHNRQVHKFRDLISHADPDILCLLEPDVWWAQQLRYLDKEYPYATKYPLSNAYGMILYSRLKLLTSDIRFLVEDDIPSIVSTVELPNDEVMALYCLHPRPPLPYVDTEERDAELLLVATQVKHADMPSLVVGDLNDVAWSHTTALFREISGLLDPRMGRGFYNTFHARIPFLRYPLDHVFFSASFRLIHLTRLPSFGSDHFPILITLSYEPENKHEQAPAPPSLEDQVEAEQMIHKAP